MNQVFSNISFQQILIAQGIATVIQNRGQFDTMGLGAMSAPTIASAQPAKRKVSTSRNFSDSEAEDDSSDSEDEIDLSSVPRESLLAPVWPMLVITDDPTQAQVHATAATSRRNQFTRYHRPFIDCIAYFSVSFVSFLIVQ
jgi:hypothetical protein